ncbi:hypothetical protein EJB05_17479 [Eragrostis curvula]|uniref:Pentacotripeptide-repeat region of PRORP domain-containing protein n=1 Tax=Eragrostis curvula TaxID=38414 RepID=A0A5J9VJ51_9POAL|nr:hypothetical protein EJB05_17479 [Eragrostis curvula]
MAAAPNASMGLLNLGGCGVSLPTSQPNSSSAGGFLVPGRSVSVLPLRWGLARTRGRILDSKTASAEATGEASSGSSELRHIEKELTFSPTFTDYVKIMESVKFDRSKNLQDGDSDGRSSRRRFTGDGDRRSGGRSGDARSKSFERKRDPRMDRGNDGGRGSKLAKNESRQNVTGFVEKRAQVGAENSRRRQGDVEEYVPRRTVRGDMRGSKLAINESQKNFSGFVERRAEGDAENSQHRPGEIEEYVQRRIVCGDIRETGGNRQFTSHVKAKDTRGGMTVHKSARDEQARPGAHKDFQEEIETFAVSRTSSPPSTSTLLKKTNSIMGKERFTGTRSMKEQKSKYPGDTKFSNDEISGDGNFQRNHQRVENLGRNVVVRGFGKNDMDCTKPTVRNRYGHVETMHRHNGRSSDSLKYDKAELIHMQRGENVKVGKFARRDAKPTDIDDRAAFRTYEVFTDVRNRPRILQKEMEERIEKLASRLNATDVNAPEWKFSKIIHDAKIKFSDHSILRIVQMLGRFGNWKRVLQVVEWLQSREDSSPTRAGKIVALSWSTVIGVSLNQLSSYPDMAAYHCIAVTLGQAGLVKELFDVIDCMRSPPKKKFKLGPLQNWDPRLEPDLIVYNAVLNACVQQKQWEGAFWVLQQLKEKNIRPTNTTYGLVMEVMLVCGKYNLVYEFFNKVEKSSIPGALNYKVLINALWREGKIDEAVMAVKDMEHRGIVGSASLYYDLARCLCSGGRCKEALLQVPKICKVANKPLVVTYTGLIQTCIDNGSMENAKYIFNEMCNYCSPNNVTCNIMLKSYVEHGMFEDAKDLLDSILNGRIRSRVDLSQNATADKFTFNTFMEACAEANRWDDFEYAFREMLSNGYHFDGRRHLRMVLDAYRSGKEQLLDDVWRYLRHHDRVPPTPLIMERFCLKLIQGDTMAAISCISSFEESKIRSVSSMSWLNLLTRNVGRLKEENITKLVRELNNLVSSGSSSDCLYQNILSSCTTFLSGATVVERAPSDRQTALHNS